MNGLRCAGASWVGGIIREAGPLAPSCTGPPGRTMLRSSARSACYSVSLLELGRRWRHRREGAAVGAVLHAGAQPHLVAEQAGEEPLVVAADGARFGGQAMED